MEKQNPQGARQSAAVVDDSSGRMVQEKHHWKSKNISEEGAVRCMVVSPNR